MTISDKTRKVTEASIEKRSSDVIMKDGIYRSSKGFVIDKRKLEYYCLNPLKLHSEEFFSVGYTTGDSNLLFCDIEKGFDMTKKRGVRKSGSTERFSIPMDLGVSSMRTFRTVWQIDMPGSEIRLITAYNDPDVLKEK